jgi:hypothetical protein
MKKQQEEEGYCPDNDWIMSTYLLGLVLEDFLSEKEGITTEKKIAAYRETHTDTGLRK